MQLTEIKEETYHLKLDLRYASKKNFTKQKIYKRSIAFLEKEMQSTTLVDMRSILFSLIEQQTEIIMLASVRSDYLFKVIDPAIVHENKSSPNRALICILGTIFGGFLSVIFILCISTPKLLAAI